MKLTIILAIGIAFLGFAVYANTNHFMSLPRMYHQKLICDRSDISKIVRNTGNTHNFNYLVTVECSSSPGQILTTAQPGGTPATSLRISASQISSKSVAFLHVQLASFDNQVKAGDQLHCTVKYIGKGRYKNQNTSWDFIIPEGKKSIFASSKAEERIIPPMKKRK